MQAPARCSIVKSSGSIDGSARWTASYLVLLRWDDRIRIVLLMCVVNSQAIEAWALDHKRATRHHFLPDNFLPKSHNK